MVITALMLNKGKKKRMKILDIFIHHSNGRRNNKIQADMKKSNNTVIYTHIMHSNTSPTHPPSSA